MNPDRRRRLDEIVARLESVASDLDDIAFDELREASAAGRGRPEIDKVVLQARRAIEKARNLLAER